MESLEMIVKALAAGAVSNFRPNVMGLADTAVIDQYQALREFIADKYDKVEADILDIGPASAGRQRQLLMQLEAVGADEDEEVLRQAEALLLAIQEHDPEAIWAATPDENEEAAATEVEAATEAAKAADLPEEGNAEVEAAKDEAVVNAVDEEE